jgi:hypothetical protein
MSSAMKSRAGGKSPTKGDVAKAAMEQSIPLERRLSMMSKTKGTTEGDLEEYKRTEILRKSVADVKLRAAADAERRKSPIKTYSGVKSKIAGNMRSQKKAKKMGSLIEQ